MASSSAPKINKKSAGVTVQQGCWRPEIRRQRAVAIKERNLGAQRSVKTSATGGFSIAPNACTV